MRNFHKVVVYDVCEIVSGHAVAFNQYIIFEVGIVDFDFSVNEVDIRADTLFGNILTNNVRFARFKFCFDFFFRKGKAMLVVFSVAVFVGERLESLFRAEAVIRPAEFDEFFSLFHINGFALALNVRTVRTADIRTFVVMQPRFV